MKKLLTILLSLLFITTLVVSAETALTRDYDGIEVPAGSFIPVLSLQDFSTAYSDSTNELKFVCSIISGYNSLNCFATWFAIPSI